MPSHSRIGAWHLEAESGQSSPAVRATSVESMSATMNARLPGGRERGRAAGGRKGVREEWGERGSEGWRVRRAV